MDRNNPRQPIPSSSNPPPFPFPFHPTQTRRPQSRAGNIIDENAPTTRSRASSAVGAPSGLGKTSTTTSTSTTATTTSKIPTKNASTGLTNATASSSNQRAGGVGATMNARRAGPGLSAKPAAGTEQAQARPIAGPSRLTKKGAAGEAGGNRNALGEVTNKKDGQGGVLGGGKGKSTANSAAPRPAMPTRRSTRRTASTVENYGPSEGGAVASTPAVALAAGASKAAASTTTTAATSRTRPAPKTRASARNIKDATSTTTTTTTTTTTSNNNNKEDKQPIGARNAQATKITSSTAGAARVGVKRTRTAAELPHVDIGAGAGAAGMKQDEDVQMKNNEDDDDAGKGFGGENEQAEDEIVEPSSKRIRTSSPAKRERDIQGEGEARFDERAREEVERAEAGAEAGGDVMEDEQLYEVEEDGVVGYRAREMVLDIDAGDHEDPTMVTEYVHDIFHYMKELEAHTMPNPEYVNDQPTLKWEMRATLHDWLIEVHHKFRLLPETLFLAVNMIDRFLSSRVVSLTKLQLVGVTCLFIAAKYEEVICPALGNFLFMADGGYEEEQILSAEKYVLTTLNFDLSFPNPMHFLRRVSKAEGYDIQTRTVAKYFMEISCLDHQFLGVRPSLLAAAGVYLARITLDRPEWDATLSHYSTYSEREILPVAQLMLNYVLSADFPRDSAFYNKYSARKYMKAAVFVREWAKKNWPMQMKGKKGTGNELLELLGDEGLYDIGEMEEPGDYE